jgi:dipeptidyl aminopeptidase/acylaminoacyl peptidase
LLLGLMLSTVGCGEMPAAPSPLSIEGMRDARFTPALAVERQLPAGSGYSAYLVAYRSDGLNLYALVAVPEQARPPNGFPVLVANHGFHPDPPRYGITADGVQSRPGDYYRAIPAHYTAEGFLVVMPDYRGHNVSEGLEYTEGFLATLYYTRDVLALLAGLHRIEQADTENVFLWGHSLGAEVTLRALLTSDIAKGASLWSPVGGTLWEQAYHYSRRDSADPVDDSAEPEARMAELAADVARLDHDYETLSGEPLAHLEYLQTPLQIHHARGDEAVPYEWSERLATELIRHGKDYVFYTYPSDDHLFAGDELRLAVQRDAAFFKRLISGTAAAGSARRQP